jgi:8-oxo-dGTP diphosphatase
MRTAGVILIHRGRVLTVRGAATGIWSFPKGSVLPGESTPAAALRELREETGIQLTEDVLGPRFRSGRGLYYVVHVDERPEAVGDYDRNEVDCVHWMPFGALNESPCFNSALRRWGASINGHTCTDSALPVARDCL